MKKKFDKDFNRVDISRIKLKAKLVTRKHSSKAKKDIIESDIQEFSMVTKDSGKNIDFENGGDLPKEQTL